MRLGVGESTCKGLGISGCGRANWYGTSTGNKYVVEQKQVMRPERWACSDFTL